MDKKIERMTVRIPQDTYEEIRREAFDRRIPINRIVIERLEAKQRRAQRRQPSAEQDEA